MTPSDREASRDSDSRLRGPSEPDPERTEIQHSCRIQGTSLENKDSRHSVVSAQSLGVVSCRRKRRSRPVCAGSALLVCYEGRPPSSRGLMQFTVLCPTLSSTTHAPHGIDAWHGAHAAEDSTYARTREACGSPARCCTLFSVVLFAAILIHAP